MDGQLGFDLETLGEGGEGLHEAAREHPVAGENVVEALAEERAHQPREQPVAEPVAAAVGLLAGIVARGIYHVELLAAQRFDETRRRSGRVDLVPVSYAKRSLG